MAARIYDTQKWRDLRKIYFQRHPLCVHCQLRGQIVAAKHLDHIKSVRVAPDLAWTWSNLQGLCASCHSSKSAQADGALGHRKKAPRIKGCDLRGFPIDPSHPWFEADGEGGGR